MKAFALGRRAKWKDYVDLYFILKNHYSLSQLADRTFEIFGSLFSEKLFRQQLSGCFFRRYGLQSKMKKQKTVSARLTDREIRGLRKAFEDVLRQDNIRVYLFGSRTDADKKGGDIDLLIECENKPSDPITRLTRALRLKIYDHIGEQKIDLVWDCPGKKDPFIGMLHESRILLWERIGEK